MIDRLNMLAEYMRIRLEERRLRKKRRRAKRANKKAQ